MAAIECGRRRRPMAPIRSGRSRGTSGGVERSSAPPIGQRRHVGQPRPIQVAAASARQRNLAAIGGSSSWMSRRLRGERPPRATMTSAPCVVGPSTTSSIRRSRQRSSVVDRVDDDRSELHADLVLEGVGGLDHLVHRGRLGQRRPARPGNGPGRASISSTSSACVRIGPLRRRRASPTPTVRNVIAWPAAGPSTTIRSHSPAALELLDLAEHHDVVDPGRGRADHVDHAGRRQVPGDAPEAVVAQVLVERRRRRELEARRRRRTGRRAPACRRARRPAPADRRRPPHGRAQPLPWSSRRPPCPPRRSRGRPTARPAGRSARPTAPGRTATIEPPTRIRRHLCAD